MSFKTTIYGKYFLLDRIAVGGMAEVFKAKTFGAHGFERLLVIKRILPHLSKDSDFVDMFIDEAKISVELNHSNICQVTDLGKIEDNHFIAMEFIDGKDLRAILKKCFNEKKSLGVPASMYILMEVLKGLDYAHRKTDLSGKLINLIHRDISPQNVMISYHGDVKIVDFGIAKTESKLNRTQAGVLKGKFGYMSPEQSSGLELDGRTDIFSAGILFYEMLTGRRLFLGENDFETLEKIKECKVPSPTKYNSDITPELEQIVYKALAKEKEERYLTAQEMLAALAKIFYTQYSTFSGHDISQFLKVLFAEEIEKEQEALRRAIDSLPQDEIKAAVDGAAAGERVVDSNASRRPGSISSGKAIKPQGGDLTIPQLQELPWMKWGKLGAKVLIPALFVILIWKWVSPSKPKVIPNVVPVATSTPFPSILETPVTSTATTGSLTIKSDPPGAKIFLNKENTDLITPNSLDGIPLNQRTGIRLELDGFEPESRFPTLTQPEETLEVTFKPKLTTINLHITPSDAMVYLNGQERGYVIDDVLMGKKYTLKVQAPGYESKTITIVPRENPADFTLQLQQIRIDKGTISLGAEPWATVSIDGKNIGETPISEYKLPVGLHRFEFSHPSYKTVRKKIQIRTGKNPNIIVNFAEP